MYAAAIRVCYRAQTQIAMLQAETTPCSLHVRGDNIASRTSCVNNGSVEVTRRGHCELRRCRAKQVSHVAAIDALCRHKMRELVGLRARRNISLPNPVSLQHVHNMPYAKCHHRCEISKLENCHLKPRRILEGTKTISRLGPRSNRNNLQQRQNVAPSSASLSMC